MPLPTSPATPTAYSPYQSEHLYEHCVKMTVVIVYRDPDSPGHSANLTNESTETLNKRARGETDSIGRADTTPTLRDNDEPQNPFQVSDKSLKPVSTFTKCKSAGQNRNKAKRLAALREVLSGYEFPGADDTNVSYLEDIPALPVGSPPGCPHLIDVEELDPTDYTGLTVADMVVTVLYLHAPETLEKFIDTSHKYSFRSIPLDGSHEHGFLVVRTHGFVDCGYVTHDKQWTVKHSYALNEGPRGVWTPQFMEKWSP